MKIHYYPLSPEPTQKLNIPYGSIVLGVIAIPGVRAPQLEVLSTEISTLSERIIQVLWADQDLEGPPGDFVGRVVANRNGEAIPLYIFHTPTGKVWESEEPQGKKEN